MITSFGDKGTSELFHGIPAVMPENYPAKALEYRKYATVFATLGFQDNRLNKAIFRLNIISLGGFEELN